MKRYLVIIFCFALLACEDSTEELIENGWTNHDYFFREDKILLTSQVSLGRLTIAGIGRIAVFDSSSYEPIVNISPQNEKSLESKPAVFEDFVMYKGPETGSNPTHLVINSATHLLCNRGSASPYFESIRLHEIDPALYSPYDRIYTNFYTQEVGTFNNLGQFLTPIRDEGWQASLCLITPNYTFSENGFSDPCATIEPGLKRIDFESETTAIYRYMKAFGSNFFVKVDGFPLLKITDKGELIETDLSKAVVKMFAHQGELYALSDYDGSLYKSDLEGEKWVVFSSGGLPTYSEMDFFHVEDSLCFYVYSQLFTLDLNSGTVTELDNLGLEGNAITSVSYFNHKVWVTTLSGLFTKEKDHFFKVKE